MDIHYSSQNILDIHYTSQNIMHIHYSSQNQFTSSTILFDNNYCCTRLNAITLAQNKDNILVNKITTKEYFLNCPSANLSNYFKNLIAHTCIPKYEFEWQASKLNVNLVSFTVPETINNISRNKRRNNINYSYYGINTNSLVAFQWIKVIRWYWKKCTILLSKK